MQLKLFDMLSDEHLKFGSLKGISLISLSSSFFATLAPLVDDDVAAIFAGTSEKLQESDEDTIWFALFTFIVA